jgi:hypothetical protein
VFERLTEGARRVIVLAQDEARLLNHDYIGSEHLLLGVLRATEMAGQGVGSHASALLGVSLGNARTAVEKIVGRGGSAPSGHVPFTPRAKQVLDASMREALELGHNYIGIEHVLLGLTRESDGNAAQVFTHLGIDSASLHERLVEHLSRFPASDATMAPAVAEWPHDHDEAGETVISGVPSSGVPADECSEDTWFPATNRDQSCAFCGRSRPRFAHRLDPKRVQFRVYDKGWTLPGFWTVCDSCEELVANGNDEELLRLMLDDAQDALVQQASLTTFRAADLGAVPLQDA